MEILIKTEQIQAAELDHLQNLVAQLEYELVLCKQSLTDALEQKRVATETSQSFQPPFDQTERAATPANEALQLAAHELRTPITSIKGFAQLLQTDLEKQAANSEASDLVNNVTSSSKPQKNLRAISGILRQVQRMEDLIERLLDSPDPQIAHLKLNAASVVHLAEFLQRIFEQQSIVYSQHLFKMQHILAEEDPTRLELVYNEAGLEQVLNNLFGNAIKYSRVGTDITLGLERHSQVAEMVIWVRDEGYGIGPEAQKHLFEQFYREDNERTAQTKGWGLGLYICRQIITRHSGRIWVESELDRGSTFYFTLPLLKSLSPVSN